MESCANCPRNGEMAVCQNLVPLVNIKIAGKWMLIPPKMVLIGIDPYPNVTKAKRKLTQKSTPGYKGQFGHQSVGITRQQNLLHSLDFMSSHMGFQVVPDKKIYDISDDQMICQ
jgi:hypothetical protein